MRFNQSSWLLYTIATQTYLRHVALTEFIQCELDWAYVIDTETFSFRSAKTKVPVGSLVLEKGRETNDLGMTFVVTKYSIAHDDGLNSVDGKKEASNYLAKKMLFFMRETGRYPPNTEFKKSYKNGSVDLTYSPSDYDIFTIKMTPQAVGQDVEDFLATLDPPSRTGYVPQEDWLIEPAKSSRSTCRSCYERIDKGVLRAGEPSFFQDHLTYKWHHITCISDKIWGIPRERLKGFDDLEVEHQQEVQALLWE